MGKQQNSLLQATSGRSDIKWGTIQFTISHREFPPFLDVLRRIQHDPKEPMDVAHELRPVIIGGVHVNLVTQVAQYLRGLTLSDQYVDPPRLPFWLGSCRRGG